jgi:hypothetical protein
MKTAVEWLADNIMPMIPFHTLEYRNNFIKFIEQSKAMEKEQIREAYISGADHVMDVQYNPSSYFNDEQYYNETFKSK